MRSFKKRIKFTKFDNKVAIGRSRVLLDFELFDGFKHRKGNINESGFDSGFESVDESELEAEDFFDAEEEGTRDVIASFQEVMAIIMTAMFASMMLLQASAAPLEGLDTMDEPTGSQRLKLRKGITMDSGAASNVMPRRMVRRKDRIRPSPNSLKECITLPPTTDASRMRGGRFRVHHT